MSVSSVFEIIVCLLLIVANEQNNSGIVVNAVTVVSSANYVKQDLDSIKVTKNISMAYDSILSQSSDMFIIQCGARALRKYKYYCTNNPNET
jgi:hypothetical protein